MSDVFRIPGFRAGFGGPLSRAFELAKWNPHAHAAACARFCCTVNIRTSAMGTLPGTILVQKYLIYYRLPKMLFFGEAGGRSGCVDLYFVFCGCFRGSPSLKDHYEHKIEIDAPSCSFIPQGRFETCAFVAEVLTASSEKQHDSESSEPPWCTPRSRGSLVEPGLQTVLSRSLCIRPAAGDGGRRPGSRCQLYL